MSSTRFLVLCFLGAVLGACASEPSSFVCPTTGITCPEGTICAAAQPVCLVTTCGNGVVDSGESCDDGNINEGDGCSPACKPEICGNNVMDPGEICDDGNTMSGDGCAGDCRSEEDCGNGVIDVGEDCDDSNDDNTDDCVMCQTAICGDGYKRAGLEECDGDNQGNPNAAGDGCSSVCQLEGCHNGRLDPDEECDDANIDNTDACALECKNARCGDGVIRAGVEECDGDVDTDGDGIQEDTCSDTCHLLGCGNGIKDPGEQCDDGDNVPGDGCSATCTFENCGNGVVDQGEQCDGDGLGNPGMTATCNADCTTSMCGDGKRNPLAIPTEECDNGTGNGTDKNCTTACKRNVCGDGKGDQESPGIEACDEGPGGNVNDGAGCSSTCQFEGCNNGVLDQGETCEDGNTDPNDTCVNCQVARCGDNFVQTGVEQCDGSAGTKPAGHNEATCGTMGAQACRWVYCGNGVLEGSEQCDDGNNTSGDGCAAACVREFCGDSVDNNGTAEACDGGPTGSATCNINCTLSSCGDGVVNTKYTVPSSGNLKEQCDDGGTSNGDGCNDKCQFERCGNGILDSGEQCDGAAGTPPVGSATCGTSGVTACRWVYCGNGILDGSEQCDNGAANSNTAACKANCTLNTCGDGFQLAGIEGCDNGTSNNGATKACTPMCQPNRCGDGYPFTSAGGTEECDDGDLENNDSCTTTCQIPECGDGQINGSEVCDDGNTGNGDGCRGTGGSACTVETGWTCTGTTVSKCTANSVCGNGIKQGSEGCDDGGTMPGDGCSMMCAVEPGWTCTGIQPSTCTHTPVCGDGITEGIEMCDYGTMDNNGVDCADGSPPAYGASNACIACTNMCMSVVSVDFCGDTAINGSEQCDGSALGGATCVSQGFGGGTLACSASCMYDTSACTAAFTLDVTKAGTGAADGTVQSSPGGIDCGSDCSESYASGTSVTLSATTMNGAVFTSWTGAPGCTNATSCIVSMTQARSVIATFAECALDATCTAAEYCDAAGACVADLDMGAPCSRDEQCVSNTCTANVCAMP
ncbi:MAG TPA: DUF4215 domain-containing protein [Kofleriaceae bacterium]|nr:DUF4215 domain-containing protein [Kofleriaceae bacterium]